MKRSSVRRGRLMGIGALLAFGLTACGLVVDNTPPEVEIGFPALTTGNEATLDVVVRASDEESGIREVRLYEVVKGEGKRLIKRAASGQGGGEGSPGETDAPEGGEGVDTEQTNATAAADGREGVLEHSFRRGHVYDLLAEAVNGTGAVAQVERTVGSEDDGEQARGAPEVQVTGVSLEEGGLNLGPVTVDYSVEVETELKSVALYIDNGSVEEMHDKTYVSDDSAHLAGTFEYDLTKGGYAHLEELTFIVRAEDVNENVGEDTSGPYEVMDYEDPEVAFNSPETTWARPGAEVTVSVDVTDNVDVDTDSVTLYVGEEPVEWDQGPLSDTTYIYRWEIDADMASGSEVLLTVEAADTNGRKVTQTQSLSICEPQSAELSPEQECGSSGSGL